MDKIEEIACQTPLVELLERVPADARMTYEHHSTHHQMIPVGRLCHEAAEAIRAYEVMTRSDGEADHLRHVLGVVRPYISDKAGIGIIGAVDAALTQSSVQPERDHE